MGVDGGTRLDPTFGVDGGAWAAFGIPCGIAEPCQPGTFYPYTVEPPGLDGAGHLIVNGGVNWAPASAVIAALRWYTLPP